MLFSTKSNNGFLLVFLPSSNASRSILSSIDLQEAIESAFVCLSKSTRKLIKALAVLNLNDGPQNSLKVLQEKTIKSLSELMKAINSSRILRVSSVAFFPICASKKIK